jgi:hypothetical protein
MRCPATSKRTWLSPYLVGTRGLLDDGHAARAYGIDALILVRPDGYIGLIADPAETETVAEYLRSLQQAPAATRS